MGLYAPRLYKNIMDTLKKQFESEKDWYLTNWDWVINGNYGFELYDNYKKQYKEAMTKKEASQKRALRSIVIQGFTTLVSKELACSYGYAQKIIVNTINENQLRVFTQQCIGQLQYILE